MMTPMPVLSPFHSDCSLPIWTRYVNSSFWCANYERSFRLPPIPGSITRHRDLLCLLRFLQAPLHVVHFSRRQLASVFREPAPPPLPLRLYTAPSAAAHAALFATSQIHQLLCIAGHMQHFMRVFAPRDRLQQQNPRQELLHFVTSAAMVQRIRFSTHQAPTLPNNHGSEVETASATNARAAPRRFCSLQ